MELKNTLTVYHLFFFYYHQCMYDLPRSALSKQFLCSFVRSEIKMCTQLSAHYADFVCRLFVRCFIYLLNCTSTHLDIFVYRGTYSCGSKCKKRSILLMCTLSSYRNKRARSDFTVSDTK